MWFPKCCFLMPSKRSRVCVRVCARVCAKGRWLPGISPRVAPGKGRLLTKNLSPLKSPLALLLPRCFVSLLQILPRPRFCSPQREDREPFPRCWE